MDIHFAWSELPLSGRRPVALVKLRDVIDAVMWSAAKFPHFVRHFDGKTIVEIAGHHEDFFPDRIPCIDQLLTFVEKPGPCLFFVFRVCFKSASTGASVASNRKENRRTSKRSLQLLSFQCS